ncbi:ABC transporter substrate-binding protein [Halostagnicola sp. A-GB9-2]|uniref:ABC transporter substrate-binding protein n=1 Tax=Halostagnicola sp. A-GB9-2 TaxID=3048066 RepID=UPI0024C03091|nr:ABC transporter substrate-binding protein [Halostagnicola sp. A-GB9-2]MDJ1434151.1 ABC transporter substrate-binding protein [Halostagnicola sp. A-GB9-2]
MVRTRRAYLAAAGGTALSALAGCFGDEGPGETLEPDTGSVDLVLNWQLGGLHVPYYVARDQGFYEDHGISVDEVERGQGSDFSATQPDPNTLGRFHVRSGRGVFPATRRRKVTF